MRWEAWVLLGFVACSALAYLYILIEPERAKRRVVRWAPTFGQAVYRSVLIAFQVWLVLRLGGAR